jgi:NAD(P)-dependent dehydrogenase (short-subunit alcohol dehydrogenase family)
MDLQLRDKVAVVTGASKGIGAGIARGFVEAGAHKVVAADIDPVALAAVGSARSVFPASQKKPPTTKPPPACRNANDC